MTTRCERGTTGQAAGDRQAAVPHAPALDGLRAIAVMIVIAAHAGYELIPGGFGVTLFFFLSGYLITTLMRHEHERTGTVSLRNFYLRRVLRIMPPLYITMAFAAVLYLAGQLTYGVDGVAVLNQIFFVTNYGKLWGSDNGLPLLLWSLAVEEHFYILFPLVYILWLSRMGGRRASLACLGLCVLPLAARVLNLMVLAESFSPNYLWTHTRIDSILFGCCLALWQNPLLDRGAYRPRLWHLAAALGVLLVTFLVRDDAFRSTVRYSMQGLALIVVFSWALQAGGLARLVLGSAVLGRIALYSYTLYLVHPIMLDPKIQAHFPIPGVPPMLISIVLMLGYAELMYRFVEQSAAALRRRLQDRAAKGAPTGADSLPLRSAA